VKNQKEVTTVKQELRSMKNQNSKPTLAKLAESLDNLAALKARDIANARLTARDAENRPWVGGK